MAFTDLILLVVLLLTIVSVVAPQIAAYLTSQKKDTLASVVNAGGRLAADVVLRLQRVGPDASFETLKAELVKEAVEKLKSPDLFGAGIAKMGYADAGLTNIVNGQVADLLIKFATPTPTVVVNHTAS